MFSGNRDFIQKFLYGRKKLFSVTEFLKMVGAGTHPGPPVLKWRAGTTRIQILLRARTVYVSDFTSSKI
uniref:Uncharacterized protein n=1 Tax=Pararge aegeria TaxID=116150 RepID=S4PXS5_9NEOP